MLRGVFFAGVMLFSVTANAAPEPFKVSIAQEVQPDSGLLDLFKHLRSAIQQRDAEAVYARVADDYYYSRDFGGMFNADASAVENFKNTITLDNSKLLPEYKDQGWNELEALLSARKFQRIEGDVCTPAEADPIGDSIYDDYWFDWAYVNGSGVRVREKPTTQSPVVAKLSWVAIDPLKNVDGESLTIDGVASHQWVHADLLNGKRGYVHSTLVGYYLQPKLCFKQVKGQWMIAGFIGGGD